MNMLLFSAGVIAVVVGLVHSVLGEVLIFKKLRHGTVIPTHGKPLLRERNVRILWATWHIVTIFGWALAAILIYLSSESIKIDSKIEFLISLIAASMFASSALVLVATKAKHPGWVGLLAVALLCWLS